LAPYWEPSAVVAPLELRVEEMEGYSVGVFRDEQIRGFTTKNKNSATNMEIESTKLEV
jgi:hypothetical protein